MPYDSVYLASMPNLALQGLSENWLLKECGHQHWMQLAAAHDKPVPEFIDDAGQVSYAAFVALRIEADIAGIQENESFRMSGRLARVGSARHFSQHTLLAANGAVSHIEMLSAFVFRSEKNNNQSVARARFDQLTSSIEVTAESERLMHDSRLMRKAEWESAMGFARCQRQQMNTAEFQPCPSLDFNGARFLYFANFQAFVERAEWGWFGSDFKLREREIYYYANINVGETLRVVLCGLVSDENTLAHWCEIQSASGTRLAEVFTRKVRIEEDTL